MEHPERSFATDPDAHEIPDRVRVLVIAGWGRSGSTILANVLGSVPGVTTLGEINNIWERGFGDDLMCSCGEPFSRCPTWQPIASRAFPEPAPTVAAGAHEASRGLGNTWLLKRRLPWVGRKIAHRADQYAAMLARLYRAAAAEAGARLLVDASKSPWHCAVAASLADFDVSVLHLIRDPRGVAHSLRKKVGYQRGGTQIYMDQHSSTVSSLAWVYRNRLVEWEWHDDSKYLQMRYEDFIADPAKEVAGILELVELGDLSAPFVSSHEVDITPSHNISGNPVRFQQGTTTLRADEAWRESMPRHVKMYVRAITWPHMSHFGYR
jgi:hypothetical protein